LSTKAKACIGIGISLGFGAALATFYFCIRRRRRSQNNHTVEGPNLPELYTKGKKRFEADSHPIYEANKVTDVWSLLSLNYPHTTTQYRHASVAEQPRTGRQIPLRCSLSFLALEVGGGTKLIVERYCRQD
jgi:hypothetical protein